MAYRFAHLHLDIVLMFINVHCPLLNYLKLLLFKSSVQNWGYCDLWWLSCKLLNMLWRVWSLWCDRIGYYGMVDVTTLTNKLREKELE